MAAALTARQARFVQEYLVDQIGAQAARRAGYAAKTAKSVETQAARLLANAGVRAAIDAALQKRAEKYEVTAERVIRQLARIALANPRDYVDEAGEALDLRKLTDDQAMAISQFEIEDVVDRHTGQVRRRTKVKLADRNVALSTLSKCLGMQTDRVLLEASVEYRIKSMTPEERVARVRELRERAERVYLPQYLAMQAANGSPVTIDVESSEVQAEPEEAEASEAAQGLGGGGALTGSNGEGLGSSHTNGRAGTPDLARALDAIRVAGVVSTEGIAEELNKRHIPGPVGGWRSRAVERLLEQQVEEVLAVGSKREATRADPIDREEGRPSWHGRDRR